LPELALVHPEGVFHLGADAGLDPLQLFIQAPDGRGQNLVFARLRGHVSGHVVGRVGSLVGTLVASIGEDFSLLPVQRAVAFDEVVDVGFRAANGVHQAGMNFRVDVGLVQACARVRFADQRCALSFGIWACHPKVPPVSLCRLAHLRVAIAAAVLR
jgi:hypothetical protein